MNEIQSLSPLALAFLGDAVHTAYVRKQVLAAGKEKMNSYHNTAKKFCNANCQASVLERLADSLSEQEKEIVRKARNAHIKHSAKNADEATYKKATAFEALVGWLFLTGQTQRLNEVLENSMLEETK